MDFHDLNDNDNGDNVWPNVQQEDKNVLRATITMKKRIQKNGSNI